MDANPIRERRTRYDDRTEQVRAQRSKDHHRPAGLAIADDARLAVSVWMKGDDLFYECCLGPRDVSDPLAGHWLRQEADKVTRVTGFHCHADFAVRLETADPWPVARARIDHHERTAL